MPAEEPQVSTEVIPLELFPGGRLLALRLVPAVEFPHRLAIVALRVDRRAPVRTQVLQELVDPLFVDWRLGLRRLRHVRAAGESAETKTLLGLELNRRKTSNIEHPTRN